MSHISLHAIPGRYPWMGAENRYWDKTGRPLAALREHGMVAGMLDGDPFLTYDIWCWPCYKKRLFSTFIFALRLVQLRHR